MSAFSKRTASRGWLVFLPLALACGGANSSVDPGSGSAGSSSRAAMSGAGGTSGGGTTVTTGETTVTTGATTGNGSGAGGGGTGGAGGAGGGAPSVSTLAILESQLPSNQILTAWLDVGETQAPSTMILAISTLGPTCSAPNFKDYANPLPRNHQLLVIGLPDALQTPGTYAFASLEVIGWQSIWFGDNNEGGGGSLIVKTGTVEVVSIDETSVVVRLADLPAYVTDFNGVHKIGRCP